jgi:hypothetical protein
VGGDDRWWCSVVSEFFVRRGREKSLPVCLALTRCRLRSGDTIPSWRALWESLVHCTLHTRGNPRTGPGSSAVSTSFSFLKVLLGKVHFGMHGAW